MKKVMLFIILLAAFFAYGCSVTGNTIAGSSGSGVSSDGGYVSIQLSDLSNEVKFYEYDDNGVKIRYFAVLGSDGEPRTAFDACDVCGGYKGYRQEGLVLMQWEFLFAFVM